MSDDDWEADDNRSEDDWDVEEKKSEGWAEDDDDGKSKTAGQDFEMLDEKTSSHHTATPVIVSEPSEGGLKDQQMATSTSVKSDPDNFGGATHLVEKEELQSPENVKSTKGKAAGTSASKSSAGDAASTSASKDHMIKDHAASASGSTTSPGKKKETLLPKEEKEKSINSFTAFEIKQMQDVEKLVNTFLKPKLFPYSDDVGSVAASVGTTTTTGGPEAATGASSSKGGARSTAGTVSTAGEQHGGKVSKGAHLKVLTMAIEKNAAKLEQTQIAVLQKELEKLITKKKQEAEKADQEAVKAAAKADLDAKKAEEERLKKEAEEKGETYVADEDFFAGLE
mmetsp:Transcript_17037/g.42228  ORF Transcript_17037/g.42228 Transcript_17037/m.42228 type:complete len:339 (-) Transcript_17037:656-1672(-)|eukprot:CAMPEP_0178989866 /NCGR_PEP_ID=MMETSP0795-20121207/4615_1 /TAXON_ID=88552 /ORGANISM="Amoebophrya sp., Strain Ameob2" /LENGTH=338 /DNA_ID=CAMNT_0020681321 /DNA_START=487 /DNA_END=1506 /DNA_ORIENTATION=+